MPEDAFEALADADVRNDATFTLDAEHATPVFGRQDDPPSDPAATDVDPGEAVDVLGTSHLLAQFGAVAREALRGHLPDTAPSSAAPPSRTSRRSASTAT